MLNASLTIGAEIEIRANRAFISDANDSSLSTAITVNSLMDNWTLNLFLFFNFFFYFAFFLDKGILRNDRLGILILSERSRRDS